MGREEEILKLKASVFDLYEEIEKRKQEIRSLEQGKELDTQVNQEEAIQIPEVSVAEEISNQEVEEVPQEKNNPESEVQQIENEQVATQEVSEKPEESVAQDIQPESQVDVTTTQSMIQPPLAPEGMETPISEEKSTNNVVYIKEDSNAPKAIRITPLQSEKLGKSKEATRAEITALSPVSQEVVKEEPVAVEAVNENVVIPTAETAVVTELNSTSDKEELKKQLQELYEGLPNIVEEDKRAAALEEINVLTKKIAA